MEEEEDLEDFILDCNSIEAWQEKEEGGANQD